MKCESIFTGSGVDLLFRQVTLTRESSNRVRSIFPRAAKDRGAFEKRYKNFWREADYLFTAVCSSGSVCDGDESLAIVFHSHYLCRLPLYCSCTVTSNFLLLVVLG